MKLKNIFILATILLLFSCDELVDKKGFKANCTGKVGEVIIVVPELTWETSIGDSVFDALSAPYKALPQDEPTFNIVQIPNSAFTSIFRPHRNIIFIDISDKYEKPSFTLETDHWSEPQVVMYLNAPDENSFVSYFSKNKQLIIDTLFYSEMKRYQKLYTKFNNLVVENKLRDEHNISLRIPGDFRLDVNTEDFIWISKETPTSSQGILIYTYDFTDPNTLTKEFLINKRDSITKKFVPGPDKGSYMAAEKRVPIYFEELTINGNYAAKIRGLWQTINYIMGGPFVSVTIIDEKRNRVITVDGYVYGGKKDKKLLLWQIESILHSIKIN